MHRPQSICLDATLPALKGELDRSIKAVLGPSHGILPLRLVALHRFAWAHPHLSASPTPVRAAAAACCCWTQIDARPPLGTPAQHRSPAAQPKKGAKKAEWCWSFEMQLQKKLPAWGLSRSQASDADSGQPQLLTNSMTV
ncbi:hypothetical protein L1887_49652 [Cichorium endivia]|nr:hypothetical protein L1887_49652 [Cichorium endivia]